MKKKLLLLLVATFSLSCSNDSFYEDSLNSTQSDSSLDMNDKSITVIGNFEDWSKLFDDDTAETIKKTKSLLTTPRPGDISHDLPPGFSRNTIMTIKDPSFTYETVTGYSNYTKTSTSRVMFTSAMASNLGLYTGRVYQTHLRTVFKNITIPNGYSPFEDDAPNCGYIPQGDGFDMSKRGYSMGSGSTNISLTTKIYFVEVDEWAGTINREYPCKASDLKWNYILWKN